MEKHKTPIVQLEKKPEFLSRVRKDVLRTFVSFFFEEQITLILNLAFNVDQSGHKNKKKLTFQLSLNTGQNYHLPLFQTKIKSMKP